MRCAVDAVPGRHWQAPEPWRRRTERVTCQRDPPRPAALTRPRRGQWYDVLCSRLVLTDQPCRPRGLQLAGALRVKLRKRDERGPRTSPRRRRRAGRTGRAPCAPTAGSRWVSCSRPRTVTTQRADPRGPAPAVGVRQAHRRPCSSSSAPSTRATSRTPSPSSFALEFVDLGTRRPTRRPSPCHRVARPQRSSASRWSAARRVRGRRRRPQRRAAGAAAAQAPAGRHAASSPRQRHPHAHRHELPVAGGHRPARPGVRGRAGDHAARPRHSRRTRQPTTRPSSRSST